VRPILLGLPFGLPLYAYGAMLCLSVLIGRYVALRLAERDGMDPAVMDRCALWTLAAALIGARLLFLVTNPDQVNGVSETLIWWNGGLVAYGGFLGGFLGSAIFCRVRRLSVLAWADCAVPSLCIGLIFTRLGCFLAGCDFGHPWDGLWGVRFPAGSPAYQEHVALGLVPAGVTHSLPVHPTQLYESAAGFILLVAVMTVRRLRTRPGQIFLSFVLGYAVLRYGIEILRADPQRGAVGAFSTSQFIAVATFLLAAASLYVSRRSRSVWPDSIRT
jgi:phosphatidylglycerol:prolipoprotein diacylglycerol transferase